ncbi:MAG: hypothetical protein ABL959_01300 [Pyrinomonadaceae bacterium]
MRNRILAITTAVLFVFGVNGTAQSMTSTAELKLACETSPGNVVAINVPTQISSGPQAPLTENVNTKCTLVLGSQVSFEASQVSMTFAGPLRIQGSNESHVLFIESEFTAPSIGSTTSSKSLFQVERSLLRATAGGIAIDGGSEGTVSIHGPLLGGNLHATGSVTLAGGLKFYAGLTDAGVSAGTGFNVNMTGNEAYFVSVTSTIHAAGGAINVTASGEKSFAEFKFNSVAASPRGINVRLNGNESEIVANQFAFDAGTGLILRTGGNKGKVTLDDGTISANGSVTVQSSITGLEGVATVTKARSTAGGSTRVETGARGSSEVLDSSLTANSLVRIATRAGGNCKSQNNIITAPIQQVCP